MSIFSHWKEALFLWKSWNKKGGHCTRFCGRTANVRAKCISSDFWEDWGDFSGSGKRALKNLFLPNLHGGSPWGRRTEQHPFCLRYAHSQHIESPLSKKQLQAKIPRAFLVSELNLIMLLQKSLFQGCHLVMRSNRCAEQNQQITLNK